MEQPDPIHYPTVDIDGAKVEVKFRCGDIIRMKKANIDIGDKTALKGADAIERMLTFLQYGLSHAMTITVDSLADKIDLAQLPVYTLAVNEALKKVSPQAAEALKILQAQTIPTSDAIQ
jgi:hypothetical protein